MKTNLNASRLQLAISKHESGSSDLLESPAMELCMRMAVAMASGQDLTEALNEIAALPLESRYVWRVASAIKWAFAEFDSVNVIADRNTLSIEDRKRLIELLNHRPLQFCLFLSDFFGQRAMEALMVSAVKHVREIQKLSESGENHPEED